MYRKAIVKDKLDLNNRFYEMLACINRLGMAMPALPVRKMIFDLLKENYIIGKFYVMAPALIDIIKDEKGLSDFYPKYVTVKHLSEAFFSDALEKLNSESEHPLIHENQLHDKVIEFAQIVDIREFVAGSEFVSIQTPVFFEVETRHLCLNGEGYSAKTEDLEFTNIRILKSVGDREDALTSDYNEANYPKEVSELNRGMCVIC